MAVVLEALQICESLESIVSDTFGPNGLDVMLNSSSGNILVTNSGALILRSLNLGHPVGRIIVDKVLSHCSVTGDGATSFLLMLTTMLREVIRHTGINRASTRGLEMSPTQQKSFLALSRAFLKLESIVLEEVVKHVLDKIAIKKEVNPSLDGVPLMKQKIKGLIVTALNGKFPTSTVNLFGTLLCDVIISTWRPSVTSLQDTVVHIIDDFPQICVEVPGLPLSSSHSKPGILIPRQFATELEGVPGTCKEFSFVVMSCSLDFSAPGTTTSFQIRNAASLDTTLKWKRSQVQRIMTFFKLYDVKLILSSESLSDLVLHFCRQYKVAVVQMIPLEYVGFICRSTGILPIADVDFDSDSLPNCFIGKGDSCSCHSVGRHKFVHLQVQSPKQQFNPHCVLLCSPAESLCKQSYTALHNALKCVKMSFSNDGKEMLFLPGAGSAEFAMSFSLKAYAHSVTDPNLCLSLQILSTALQTIPKVLHRNSFSTSHQKTSFVYCISEVERSWKGFSMLLGIDSKSGKPLDLPKVYDPLPGKYLLLRNLLQCLAQLLKTDKLVGVKSDKGYAGVSKDYTSPM